MPLRRYVCQIAYALLLQSAYRLHIAACVCNTSNPVGFELSSNMHMHYVFGDHIYSLSITTYIFLAWWTYFFCIYTKNIGNASEVLSWQPQIFYIYKPYLFFQIYDPLSIPCLAVIFVVLFYKSILCFAALHKHSHLAAIVIFSHPWPFMDSLFGSHITFSLFMPKCFKIIHICVYIQKTKVHKVLSWQPQIFLYTIVVPSHVWSLKYSLLGSHICFWQMPMKILLQFINISHFAAILFLYKYEHLQIYCLVEIFIFSYWCKFLLKLYTCICTKH